MEKSILIQYCDLLEERKDIRKRIDKVKKEINDIEKEGAVFDTVRGGDGGIQRFCIEGFPHPQYDKKKRILRQYERKLEECDEKIWETTLRAEEYIESVEKSEMRSILRLYIIDNLTAREVADRMNSVYPKRRVKYTDENIKKRIQRFFEKEDPR